eukprot:1333066-Rhodomonas_salina.1
MVQSATFLLEVAVPPRVLHLIGRDVRNHLPAPTASASSRQTHANSRGLSRSDTRQEPHSLAAKLQGLESRCHRHVSPGLLNQLTIDPRAS